MLLPPICLIHSPSLPKSYSASTVLQSIPQWYYCITFRITSASPMCIDSKLNAQILAKFAAPLEPLLAALQDFAFAGPCKSAPQFAHLGSSPSGLFAIDPKHRAHHATTCAWQSGHSLGGTIERVPSFLLQISHEANESRHVCSALLQLSQKSNTRRHLAFVQKAKGAMAHVSQALLPVPTKERLHSNSRAVVPLCKALNNKSTVIFNYFILSVSFTYCKYRYLDHCCHFRFTVTHPFSVTSASSSRVLAPFFLQALRHRSLLEPSFCHFITSLVPFRENHSTKGIDAALRTHSPLLMRSSYSLDMETS